MCDCGILTYDDFMGLCTSPTTQSSGMDVLSLCVATGDCAQVGGCLADALTGSTLTAVPAGDDPCDRYCRAAVDCGGGAVFAGCRATCAARLAGGDPGPLAAVGCWEAGGCDGFTTCAAAAPTSAACQTACDAAPAACANDLVTFDAKLSACTAYCAGLVTTWGADDAATAGCVAGAADRDCVLPAAACAPLR